MAAGDMDAPEDPGKRKRPRSNRVPEVIEGEAVQVLQSHPLPAMLISLTPSPTLSQEGISAASLAHGSGCFQRVQQQLRGKSMADLNLPLPRSACHYYKPQNYALKGSESSFAR